jgi:hypothetical protein
MTGFTLCQLLPSSALLPITLNRIAGRQVFWAMIEKTAGFFAVPIFPLTGEMFDPTLAFYYSND